DLAFALADLIVSRSGSATVSEVSALGIPAVYVPYSVGNGEQRLNAASAVSAGAALLLDDASFDGDAVRERIIPLLRDRAPRGPMPSAAAAIASIPARSSSRGMIRSRTASPSKLAPSWSRAAPALTAGAAFSRCSPFSSVYVT
ncbi:glycosyltransferase, partial [Clavibacter michiganensis]|uniref:glycosyltransferase n=1 Tax=Clavibacter michiganensis TaxID=28447 RepID=UPI00292DFEF1